MSRSSFASALLLATLAATAPAMAEGDTYLVIPQSAILALVRDRDVED